MTCPSPDRPVPATLQSGSRMSGDRNLDRIYREESGRILATLIRLLGSFDLAEEVMQEAFAVALERWPTSGAPDNPRAWLISTAHHKGVDILRRRTRLDARREELQRLAELEQRFSEEEQNMQQETVSDDRLRL